MGLNQEKKVWIIGHKNPDTDSICAAIAYADLKNKISEIKHEPKRAGSINEETRCRLHIKNQWFHRIQIYQRRDEVCPGFFSGRRAGTCDGCQGADEGYFIPADSRRKRSYLIETGMGTDENRRCRDASGYRRP